MPILQWSTSINVLADWLLLNFVYICKAPLRTKHMKTFLISLQTKSKFSVWGQFNRLLERKGRHLEEKLIPTSSFQSWQELKPQQGIVTWGSKWLWPSPRAVPLFPQRSSEDSEKASGSHTATQLGGTGLSPKLNLMCQMPPPSNIGHSRIKLHCCMLCRNSTLHITQLTLLLYPASTLVH